MKRNLAIAAAVGALAISAAGCASHPQAAANTQPVQATVAPSPAPATSSISDGHRHTGTTQATHRTIRVPAGVPMPNQALTPGAIQSSDTAAICTPGWAEGHRNVSYATEDHVAQEYGLSSHYGYEIDHLIPLELGGSNSVRNLWPYN